MNRQEKSNEKKQTRISLEMAQARRTDLVVVVVVVCMWRRRLRTMQVGESKLNGAGRGGGAAVRGEHTTCGSRSLARSLVRFILGRPRSRKLARAGAMPAAIGAGAAEGERDRERAAPRACVFALYF